jgi:hypothetical protein
LLNSGISLFSAILGNSINKLGIPTEAILSMYRPTPRKRISYFLKGSRNYQQRRRRLGKHIQDDDITSQIGPARTANRPHDQPRPNATHSRSEHSEPLSHPNQSKHFNGMSKTMIPVTTPLENTSHLGTGKEAEKSKEKQDAVKCQCQLPGCLRCFPGDYHAIYCGLSSCKDCADRGAGYDEWHVCQTGSDEDIFTGGDAVLSRTYNGRRNVLCLVLSRRLFTAMRCSVIEGRRYRKTKREIDAELDKIEEDAQPAWQDYQIAIHDLRRAKKYLGWEAPRPMLEERRAFRELKRTLRRTQLSYRVFKTREQRLKGKLKKAERKWFACLTDLDYFEALFLEHAGSLQLDKDKGWRLDAYNYHHRIRSRSYGDGDVYDGEDTDTDTDTSPQSPPSAEHDEVPAEVPQSYQDEQVEIRGDWVRHLADCEAQVEFARQQYDSYRDSHGALLYYRFQDNPGRDLKELKDEYGPQFVQLAPKYVEAIQNAEERLENERAAARTAGMDPYAEHAYDQDGDEDFLNELIAQDAQKLIANVDHGKISRWLDTCQNHGPWPVLELNPDGGFGSETGSIDSESSAANSDSEEPQIGDKSGSRPPHHSHEKTRLMTSDVNLDSISVFDEYDYIRRHIAGWATEKRGGYL